MPPNGACRVALRGPRRQRRRTLTSREKACTWMVASAYTQEARDHGAPRRPGCQLEIAFEEARDLPTNNTFRLVASAATASRPMPARC